MPYRKTVQEVAAALHVNPETGLSDSEVQSLREEYGPNALAEGKKKSALALFLEQFKNPLLIILTIGAVISGYTGHTVDAIAIAVIIAINALISFFQELKAQKSLESLKQMAAPNSEVMRNGKWGTIPSHDLVPGDILKLNTGDVVGADLRFIQANRMQIDESMLTGESVPSDKTTDPILSSDVSLGDQSNMAFMSTIVSGGGGVGVVTSTGMDTEVGHIAKLMSSEEKTMTPLQKRLHSLSKILIGAALLVVAIVIGIGVHHGMDLLEMLNTGISLSVAAIPEGLPTVVTIVLTIGSQRMARSNALVRQLASVETLGSTTVICSDKTGTLTQNQMQVTHMHVAGQVWESTGRGFDPNGKITDEDGNAVGVQPGSELDRFLRYSVLCNEATLEESDGVHSVRGNPTEGALLVVAAKAGLDRDQLKADGYEIVKTFPFDSTRKMMSVLVRDPLGDTYAVVKGAPDVILRQSGSLAQSGGKVSARNDELDLDFNGVIDRFGRHALRNLAVAYRKLEPGEEQGDHESAFEKDLTLLGIHGMIDPPRAEVIDSIAQCREAGIRTVMITGDHAGTAEAIARAIGIIESEDELVVTGSELDSISDSELQQKVAHAAVFARVSPEHKLRIVKALQANGHVTAMTGDGVNDAPALRAADIGVAMGITGTQVAKDSAELVLLDDNFSTIVSAVREGRRIFDNTKKFIRQELTANVAEISAILFAFLMSGSDPMLPLTALMILWVNLVSDGLPALALGVDNEENDLMRRKPRAGKENFFDGGLPQRIVIRGLALGWLTYFLFNYSLEQGSSVAYAQTVAFATIIFGQLIHVFDSRTFTTIFRRNPFKNHWLLLAVGCSAVLSLLVIYTPIGQTVFGTEPLQGKHLAMLIAISSLPTFALSALKEIFHIKLL
ncbi:MAG: cation-translocating P-type ATPase [Verrucomicrobiales bacterium]